MKNKFFQQGFVPVVIAIIVAIGLAAGAGGYVYVRNLDPIRSLSSEDRAGVEQASENINDLQEAWNLMENPDSDDSSAVSDDIGSSQEGLGEEISGEPTPEERALEILAEELNCLGDCDVTLEDIQSVLEWAELAEKLGAENADELLEAAKEMVEKLGQQLLDKSPCDIRTKADLERAFKEAELVQKFGSENADQVMDWLKKATETYIRNNVSEASESERYELAALARMVGLNGLFRDVMQGQVDPAIECQGFSATGHSVNTFKVIAPFIETREYDATLTYDVTIDAFSCADSVNSEWIMSHVLISTSPNYPELNDTTKSGKYMVNFTNSNKANWFGIMYYTLSEDAIHVTMRPMLTSEAPVDMQVPITRGGKACKENKDSDTKLGGGDEGDWGQSLDDLNMSDQGKTEMGVKEFLNKMKRIFPSFGGGAY